MEQYHYHDCDIVDEPYHWNCLPFHEDKLLERYLYWGFDELLHWFTDKNLTFRYFRLVRKQNPKHVVRRLE